MLGRSQAVELGRRGACVGVNDLGGSPRGGGSDPTMAQVAVDQIRSAGSEAVANTEDIASADGPRLLVEQALDTWGRVDGVVHNAAILRNAHFENVSDADYDDIMHVNLRGTFRTVQAVYRAMKDRGGGRILPSHRRPAVRRLRAIGVRGDQDGRHRADAFDRMGGHAIRD
jgi:NAD(P)-dependent dehydrogenase (short-subunit alcohol dehydrogenase family)